LDRPGRPEGKGLASSSGYGKESAQGYGRRVQTLFPHHGDYDIVAIYEAPDDAVAARFNLQLGMLGNIRTRTLKAFPEAAYREIINSLG
jgi:uncharacterized protein with GYD domain